MQILQVDGNDPTRLVPLIIAGGGGGMADISSDNNPDATTIFDQDMMKLSEVVPDMDHNGITTETTKTNETTRESIEKQSKCIKNKRKT